MRRHDHRVSTTNEHDRKTSTSRRRRLFAVFAVIGATVGGVVPFTGANAATGPGPCSLNYHWCLGEYSGGQEYRFSTYGDSDLHTNHYGDGTTVGDHAKSIRNRWPGMMWACGYRDTGYSGGLLVKAHWNNYWVHYSDGRSSSGLVTDHSACPL